MRSDQQQAINRLAGTSATAFLCAVLCVYPLYIDKFSNLGVTKFTGCFTLFLLFLLWLVACTAIGARAPRPRNANAGRDVTLWGVLAFAGTSLISTFTSLSPTASTWGLGGYYGGLMLVLFTAAGYWAVRSYLDLENLDFVFWVLGITTSIVAVLYVLNIFNIDLIGAYADTAVVERAQFFSTLGQKDFNGCFFSVALPIVFYQFLNAKDTRTAVGTGIPAAFGALALAVVDSEALALGIGAAVMVLVCHPPPAPCGAHQCGVLRLGCLDALHACQRLHPGRHRPAGQTGCVAGGTALHGGKPAAVAGAVCAGPQRHCSAGPTVPAGAGHHHCCAGGGSVGLCAGQCNAKPAPAGKPA